MCKSKPYGSWAVDNHRDIEDNFPETMQKGYAMFRKLLIAGILALFTQTIQASDWETDFAKASTNAAKEGRFILLDFTGSDWCGWCIKLQKEVFSQEEFKTFAKDNLVCVELDFPRGKTQSTELKEQNKRLSEEYGIQGFPTIVLLSPKGEKVATTGYRPGGAKAYVAHLKGIIDNHKKQGPDKAVKPADGK